LSYTELDKQKRPAVMTFKASLVTTAKGSLIGIETQTNGIKRSSFLSKFQAETLVKELNAALEALKGINADKLER
jgi:hypothetical protein